MKHSNSLLTPAQCLSRALGLTIRPHGSWFPMPTRQFSQAPRPQVANQQIPRARFKPEDKLAAFTRDRQIQTQYVQVKQDDGSVGSPELLSLILRRINRQEETVIQLSKPGDHEAAIVQISKIAELRERAREKEKAEREKMLADRDKEPKQIELNWAISENDLEMKLKQMEQFLDKGKKVEIMLAAKRRARRATPEEGEAVLRKIKERLVEVDAKEVAPMDGQVLKQAMVTVRTKKNLTELQRAVSADEEAEKASGRSTRLGSRQSQPVAAKFARAAARRERAEAEKKMLEEEEKQYKATGAEIGRPVSSIPAS